MISEVTSLGASIRRRFWQVNARGYGGKFMPGEEVLEASVLLCLGHSVKPNGRVGCSESDP